MDWGEVNPVHAYYNGSCTSKDNEDPSWSTSFKTRRTQKTSSALEVLWKTLFLLYLYLIGTLYHQEELYIHKEEMAPMALSDSEVKTCSKTCLTNYETLKKQYDDLIFKLHETEFKAINYKRGLDTVEAQLVTYRKNEVLFNEEVVVLKREVGVKQYEINMLKIVFEKPNKLDLSYSGLEEFQEPEFVGYGVKVDKIVSENSSVKIKKTPNAPIIEEWVSDDKEKDGSPVVVENKTVVHTIPKVNVVKSKQKEKLVRKPVKYAEMYRS
ncbi:hypothetical protein Tco_0731579 [Tanacetum coccineum]